MRVVFMGTPDFSVPTLKALAGPHQVIAAYTQPPKPAGRGMNERKSPVHLAAECEQVQPLVLERQRFLAESPVQPREPAQHRGALGGAHEEAEMLTAACSLSGVSICRTMPVSMRNTDMRANGVQARVMLPAVSGTVSWVCGVS